MAQVWNTAFQVVAQGQRGAGADFCFRAFMDGPVARVRRKPARARWGCYLRAWHGGLTGCHGLLAQNLVALRMLAFNALGSAARVRSRGAHVPVLSACLTCFNCRHLAARL